MIVLCLSVVMPHMEVDHILQVCPLHTDSERVCGVESKSHESPGLGRRIPALHTRVYFKLEQPALSPIEPDWMFSTSLGSLHNRHPLVIVGEEGQVEEGGGGERLSRDWKLSKNSFPCLIGSTIFCTNNGLLEPLLDKVGVDVVTWRAGVSSGQGHTRIAKQITEVFEQVEQLLGGVLVHSQHFRGLNIV